MVRIQKANLLFSSVHANARSLYDRGEFVPAIEIFEKLSDEYLEKKEFPLYLECMHSLLIMYFQKEDKLKVKSIKDELEALFKNPDYNKGAMGYFVLGQAYLYKNKTELAFEQFQKALSLALKEDSKKDMCYAIYGLGQVHAQNKNFERALQEVQNLKVFFEVISIPDLKVGVDILLGRTLKGMQKHSQALEVLWGSLNTAKADKSFFRYLQILHHIGVLYFLINEKDQAKTYLQLVKNSLDPESHLKLFLDTEKKLSEIGINEQTEYDLVFDVKSHSITEKRKGKIDFNNQFILLDLLQLFVKNPGEIFSKDDIVKRIWGQDYSPNIHDNKIYVTIKRLRKLIEPDYNKPRYIFRAKNGYFFSKQSRVRLHN